MNKEVVVHVHNAILLSHKKKQNWVILSDVDKPRVCQTEWSKSEGEIQILYIYTYVWNLEKWYWWTYLQDKNQDADAEKGLVDTEGEGEGGMIWDSSTDIHYCV